MKHSDFQSVHKGAYVEAVDPALDPVNNVWPGKLWVVKTGSPPYALKMRNDADDGWDDVGSSISVEQVQDIVGAMMVAGSNSSWVYDDAAGTLRVDTPQLTNEQVQDAIGGALANGTNTTFNYNDAGNLISFNATDTTRTNEEIMDVVAALLAQGTNITLVYNDAGDLLTVNGSAGASSTGTVTTASYTTAAIADTVAETGTVTLAKNFILLKIEASHASRVRVYSNSVYRTADVARAIGVAPTSPHGLIQESVLTVGNLIDDSMPKPIGSNQENPRTANIPIAIQNRAGLVQAVTVTFTFLILES